MFPPQDSYLEVPVPVVDTHGQKGNQETGGYRPEDHAPGIILNLFLVFGADAGDDDHDHGHDFAVGQELIHRQMLELAVDTRNDASQEVQVFGTEGIHEEFQQECHVNDAPKEGIGSL